VATHIKLVLTDTLFDPPQLLNTNAGAIANNTSTQRDFIPMLFLERKVSNREGQAFEVPSTVCGVCSQNSLNLRAANSLKLIT
jgi:hypothetical protein